ncbi:MAG: glycosyltransferase family 39 protein [bacterium]|nr:glycosyltransferase family 39 protein [bacterium]
MDKEKKILLIILLFTLASRLVFLHWNAGEYTDGIIQMTLFTTAKENTFYPPLYSWLIQLFTLIFRDLETSAKLVSMLAGTLSIIPIYLIAKRLFNAKSGFYAAMLFAISPEIWRWHIRIMTDSLFTLFFIWSIYFILCIRQPTSDIRNLSFAWFFAGLASLTRYQGIALIPPLLLQTVYIIRRGFLDTAESDVPRIPYRVILSYASVAIIPWLSLIWWVGTRGFGHIGQYAERTGENWVISIMSYLTMAESFVLYIPYELTYLVFSLFIYGIITMNQRTGEWVNRRTESKTGFFQSTDSAVCQFNIIFMYLFVVWLIIHSPFESFQYRYFIPIFPFFLILAAYGITRFTAENAEHAEKRQKGLRVKKTIVVITMMSCLIFSLFSLYLQRDTFGDIKRAAIALKESQIPKDTRIFGNELYRPGMDNLKLEFWSGLNVEPYNLETREHVLPGDYIVLHNVYGNIVGELDFLQSRYKVSKIYQSLAQTVPLLPDIMVSPPFTSHPACMLFKYFPQKFITIIVRIEKRNDSSE